MVNPWRRRGEKSSSQLHSFIGLLRSVDGKILTLENGKPLEKARGEIKFSASFFHWFAEECRRSYGDVIPSPVSGKELFTIVEPLGVAALICPWNFPIGMPARKVSAALAAGCTCVIKPAEDTPLSTIELVKIIQKAGIPQGVVNVITCSRDNVQNIGTELCTNPKVSIVSFTGSCEVGRTLYSLCGKSLKRVALELGGNAPFIIFSSANLQSAVNGLMGAKFRNAGQTCVTANRILIQEDVYDEVLKMFTEQVKKLKVGNGIDAEFQQGPLINNKQKERVARIVAESVAKGATVVCGGKQEGNGFEPTILTDLTVDMPCWKEEIFGPVASILKFKDEAEAVNIANNTDRGLAAYFYSSDYQQISRVSRSLEAGMIGENDVAISTTEAPFGGYKSSGIGKEGSKYGLDEYSNRKLICKGGL
ncbi:succinate-semialdehyde dehydrogenase, mitochondrial isoform X2 [Eurytemora carolleeae]|uniref:succinate-semialdehyde dehydrogenase, mitochondrial isoform X2 n=1 Tax=Eurytemora carolleeae TaxID=1294199 RepID=UPI000C76D8E5|nr:succinate-semialdehyde dehydrogenase, mitochondrial isoform X2 [Eurytemora carolleeae]|eukprot:XP_023343673.1 succinate-semialdehyde dehydrogenase, mitochondrial-like isoform X2 [Eurytemora affinis]